MVATPLDPAVIYNNVENLTVYWVPTIADITAPTRAELDAGTDLTGNMPTDGVTGFSTTGSTVPVSNLATGFTGDINNGYAVDKSSLKVYLSADPGQAGDVRTLLTRGTRGNVVLFDTQDVAAALMDIYPVQVNGLPKTRDTSTGTMVEVGFSSVATPAENVAVPAAT